MSTPASPITAGDINGNPVPRAGSVVPLDPERKIWRYALLWITNDFKATQRGKVSKAIPRSLQRVLESEINRRPMAPDYQA